MDGCWEVRKKNRLIEVEWQLSKGVSWMQMLILYPCSVKAPGLHIFGIKSTVANGATHWATNIRVLIESFKWSLDHHCKGGSLDGKSCCHQYKKQRLQKNVKLSLLLKNNKKKAFLLMCGFRINRGNQLSCGERCWCNSTIETEGKEQQNQI